MAKATSQLHRSLTGAIGDLIFRNYNGKTVVSLRPVYKNETNTEARRQSRGRFRDATDFAGIAMTNPKQKAYYQQKARQLKLPNAYTAAITDYLRKAKVAVITRSSFAAKKGEVMMIKIAKRPFVVRQINAILYNAQGEVLAEQTLIRPDYKKLFHFTLPADVPDYSGLRITTDEPINKQYTIEASTFIKFNYPEKNTEESWYAKYQRDNLGEE